MDGWMDEWTDDRAKRLDQFECKRWGPASRLTGWWLWVMLRATDQLEILDDSLSKESPGHLAGVKAV